MKNIHETIDELRDELARVERHEDPVTFLEGHGLQSRRFRFTWNDGALAIDFDLPCARVLSGDDVERSDDAEIAAVCRMAILLLSAHENSSLFCDGEARLDVVCGDAGTYYEIRDKEGEIIDSSSDWNVLAARLDAAFADSNQVVIINP